MGSEEFAIQKINAILRDIYSKNPQEEKEWQEAWNKILEQKKNVSDATWQKMNSMLYFEMIGMVLDHSGDE